MPRFTQFVAYFSSRLGTKLDEQDIWFDALRTLILTASVRDETLLACSDTTSGKFCRRAAQLFGKTSYEVRVSARKSIVHWLRKTLEAGTNDTIFVSPRISSGFKIDPAIDRIPVADRALVALADRYVGLRIRKNGNVHQLFRQICDDESIVTSNMQLLIDRKMVPPDISHELTMRGAISRFLWHPQVDSSDSTLLPRAGTQKASIISLPSRKDWQFLSHWTRRAKHEWPNQEPTDYQDQLILGCESKDRSSLAALTRILQSKTILATQGSNSN